MVLQRGQNSPYFAAAIFILAVIGLKKKGGINNKMDFALFTLIVLSGSWEIFYFNLDEMTKYIFCIVSAVFASILGVRIYAYLNKDDDNIHTVGGK